MPVTVQPTSVKVNIYASGGAPSTGFTNPMTTLGDMIYGGVAGVATRLGIGSTNQVLTVIGGVPVWQTPPASGVTSVTGTINQITASPTSGAVVLTLPSNVIFPGTWQIGTLGYSDTGILWGAQSSVNSYNQVVLQNTNSGATASTNYNVSNNLGTATTFFGEFGINSSGFTGSGIFNQPSYVYLASASTDLVIGTYASNNIHFVVNSGTTDSFKIAGTGLLTFLSNVNSNSFAGLWTATANNNTHLNFGGTFTGRASQAADQLIAYSITPTLVTGTAGQTLTGLLISPTFTPTGGAGTYYPLRVQQAGGSTDLLLINNTTGEVSGYQLRTNTGGLTFGGYTGASNATIMTSGSNDLLIFNVLGSATQAARMTSTNVNIGTGTTNVGKFYVLQSALSSSWTPIARFDGGQHANQTASTEFIDVDFRLDRFVQWNAGTVATQRQFYIRGVTYTGATPTATFTDAYSLFIDQPIAGTNASITNRWALGLNGALKVSGAFKLDLGSDATGDIYYRNSSGLITRLGIGSSTNVLTVTGGVPVWAAAPTGITNTAANNELAKSNGTNLVPSGLFSTVAGDLTFGTGLTGTGRNITADGSATNVGLSLLTKGTGSLSLINGAGTASITLGALAQGSVRTQVTDFHFFEYNSANTNTVPDSFYIQVSTSGTAAVGLGTRLTFATESAGSSSVNGSSIDSVSTNVTGGSEAFNLIFRTMTAGATATERLRINNNGISTDSGTSFVKFIVASATLDFPSTAAGAVSDLTLTVTGAALNDQVSIGAPNGSVPATGAFFAWVSAADTVKVRYFNNDLVTSRDPASGTYKIIVFKTT